MNWFKRIARGLRAAEKASELAQDVRTVHRAWEEVAGSVHDLRTDLEAQQRAADTMLAEWATTLDKIGRWAARQSARERRDTHKSLDTLATGTAENGQPAEEATLTKPQLRALAARMRMGPNVTSHEGS